MISNVLGLLAYFALCAVALVVASHFAITALRNSLPGDRLFGAVSATVAFGCAAFLASLGLSELGL